MEGWFKFERKWLDNGVINRDSDHLAVWVFLHAHAVFEPCQTLFGKDPVVLQPGQVITGRRSLSEQLKIAESKITRILRLFEKAGLIRQKMASSCRMITLLDADPARLLQEENAKSEQHLNRDKAPNDGLCEGSPQKSEPHVDRTWTACEPRANTYKECKNEKNDKTANKKRRVCKTQTRKDADSIFTGEASYDLQAFTRRAIGLEDPAAPQGGEVTEPLPAPAETGAAPPQASAAFCRGCAHPAPPA